MGVPPDAALPPKPPVKGGTAATITTLSVSTVVQYAVGKFAEMHPTPLLGSAMDQAMWTMILSALIAGPAGLLAAWWQHKKEKILRQLEREREDGAGV